METQKCSCSRLSKFMYLCSNLKVIWSRFPRLIYFFSNSEVYLKNTSFQQNSRRVNEVLLKYKQSTFFFLFFCFCVFYTFFRKLLLMDFKVLKYKWSILKVYWNILPIQFFLWGKVCKNTFDQASNSKKILEGHTTMAGLLQFHLNIQ